MKPSALFFIMSDRDPKQRCVICGNMVIDKEAGRHMRNDGPQTLLNSCAQSGDDLQLRLVGVESKDVKFHEECRRCYNDKRRISRVDCPPDPFSPSKKRKSTLRSQLASFNWYTDCFSFVLWSGPRKF
ncbi:hypothetical protein SNE40_021883 [Patella caerulea]|uniref:Uncharacterized protein n=1 Tax=Patella caerulea TaxID=87958 RepID=A0AAN8G0G7_PATCE